MIWHLMLALAPVAKTANLCPLALAYPPFVFMGLRLEERGDGG
jgi:hypothetical protein